MIDFDAPGTTIKMLVDEGILKAGSTVYGSLANNVSGILSEDGDISLVIDNKFRKFPFPSGAARAVEKRSLNGWIYWKIMDEDTNTFKELKYYRDKYVALNK